MNTRTPRKRSSSRHAQKQATREALIAAALELLENESFSAISLRRIAREAGVVPTAFYRHFESTEELGLALIDESFRALRGMIREARSDPSMFEHIIRRSVEILVGHIRANSAHWRFIARERFGGVATIRHAIRAEIRLFASELATDLARFPQLREWSTEDLNVMAGLIVNLMVSIVEEVLETPAGDDQADAELRRLAEKQLLMVVLGMPAWRSRPTAGD